MTGVISFGLTAVCVEIKTNLIVKECNLVTPLINHISNCADKDELEGLTMLDQRKTTT